MNDNQLLDLEMAGVRWELNETPFFAAQNMTPVPLSTGAAAMPGRTQTRVVPPIAPTMSMSVDTARAMAARPVDINTLNRMIGELNHPLRDGATNTVGIHVAPNPNGLLIITDVPSGDDDASGNILTGAAGDLLDKMIGAIGMGRDSVSMMPMIFWRTPGGRTPSAEELDLARPFVNRAIELLRPRVILTLGTLPASHIAGATLPRDHGKEFKLESGAIVVPIFHPNYLILKPGFKRDAWTALQNTEKLLKTLEK